MNTNVLVALKNLLESRNNKLLEIYGGSNRANNMGDALEYYIKDLFCNSLDEQDFDKKDRIYSEYLSYSGAKNNPPDFIVKKHIAVEVKKIQGLGFGNIALNSSYPKDYIYSNSKLITEACRTCEDEFGGWDKKDIVYAIGNIDSKQNKLKVLWLLYGNTYCADQQTYLRYKEVIKEGIEEISGVDFSETNELGKIHNVDPLKITELRIRGMWSIKHPMKVFSYLTKDYFKDDNFRAYVLMLKSDFNKIDDKYKEELNKYIDSGLLSMENVEIKNPNNPVKYVDAILYKTSF
ncbi:NgoPII family restriction endonuclease [Tepidibacter formicigenes]|uniref:NgoPII restriction endonuclease n=1 Tax=Tepidibacter formicigenes DSM 15518 TaxID=1123349 RepID=A0A1M6T0L6_9FIRM|nr:NgoPII family restriction endonuclease [Tepidibacter formicigenes]SHK50484.1 NgoPII restriction endonuclease [Tepidibacter formicigenes DSM 15518]